MVSNTSIFFKSERLGVDEKNELAQWRDYCGNEMI